MSRQDLNLGTNANDGTGDKLRTAMKKVNDNFIELYARTGGDGTQNIDLSGNVISCNGNLIITTNETGSINLEDLTNINANLDVFGRVRINTADNDTSNDLIVGGNAKVKGNTTLGDNTSVDRVILNSTITGAIIPSADNVFDLGTQSLRFRDIYVGGTLRASNVLFSDVNISGGTINNTLIGNMIPSEATFTKITVTGDSNLGNITVRNNLIYGEGGDGSIELRTNGGNVYIPSTLIVGVGTDTGELAQINGNLKVVDNVTINGILTAGTINANDVEVNGRVTAIDFVSTVADGEPPFIVSSGTMVANLHASLANWAAEADVASTVTTAAQPNITSLGSLTNLTVNGNVSVGTDLVVSGDINVTGVIRGDKAIITYMIDGGGDPITTGSKRYLGPINFNGTIQSATLVSDQVGSIEIEIRRCSFENFDAGVTAPSSADKITALTPLVLSSSAKYRDTDLIGWSVDFTEDDIFEFIVNSATDITWVQIILGVIKG